MPTMLHNPASLFNGEGQQHPPFTRCWLTVEAQHKTPLYKSTRCPMIGMAFISDLMQRYSPRTVMRATQTTLTIHHQNVCGTWPLNSQHPRKWPRWTVAAKSRHCFVRPTTSHMMNALQHAKVFLTGLHILTHHQLNDECTATQNTHLTGFYWPTKAAWLMRCNAKHIWLVFTDPQKPQLMRCNANHIWLNYIYWPTTSHMIDTLQHKITSDWIITLHYTPALPYLAKHIWLDYTPALPCHYTPCKTYPTGLYPGLALPLHTLQNTSNWIIPWPCLAITHLAKHIQLDYTPALPCHYLAKHIWLDYTPALPCHYTPCKTHPTGLYPGLALPLHTSQNTSDWIIPLPCLAITHLEKHIQLDYTPALPCHYTLRKTHLTGLYPGLALPLHTSQNTSDWIIPLPCLTHFVKRIWLDSTPAL